MSAILDGPFLDISRPGFDDVSLSDQCAVIEVRHEGNLFGAYRTFEVSIDGQSVGSAGRKTPGGCFVPCFTVLAICELVVFIRMRPGSPPGHLFRLIRHEINPQARRSD